MNIKRVNWNEIPNDFKQFWSEELENRTDISIPDKNVFTALCAMSFFRLVNMHFKKVYDDSANINVWLSPYARNNDWHDGITIIQVMSAYIKGVTAGKVNECIHHLADAGLIECPPYGKTKNEQGLNVIMPMSVRINIWDCLGDMCDLIDYVIAKKKEQKAKEDEYRNAYLTKRTETKRRTPNESSYQDEESKRNKWIDDTRKQLITNATTSELNVKTMFDSSNVSYVFQQPFVTSNKNIYFVDFYIPSLKIGIEVDGGYHTTREQRINDLERTIELEDNFGIRIYRIDNSDTSYGKLLQHCLSDIIYRRKNELGNWDIIL